ncbi:dihydrofolate reductase family protein [Pseudonocardia sp. WMMC193]|uniref:dihydrofolate reductase family protein n=1 Tax=Pseudonocardia sp. WMMC193 TaxID=2911965 RepID=UPI001F188DD7|nr:dihydrofolate reductase family protein [Pseudonocardia sp. WMMC193]MCF7553361.1 dihydrofolate reductase family protein [Pseudonocardia sp. WMMC193]
MRHIVHFVNVSLDGRICGPAGEFDWAQVGEDYSELSFSLQTEDTTLLYGRAVWEMMAGYWPTADEQSDHPHTVRYAPIWRAARKVVASRTLEKAEGAELVRSVDEIAALDGRLLLMGGGGLAGAVAAAGLLDELRIAVHPVVLGGDHAVLSGAGRLGLTLRESRVLDGRVVLSTYAGSR